ncbi:MAG: ABC transporter ATP-binding protein [Flammeovirgaceae bacterium]
MSKKTRGEEAEKNMTFKERFEALKNIPKFFVLVWETSPYMAISIILLRLFKALIPLMVLYIGKLIVDEVIILISLKENRDFSYLWWCIAAEFGVTVLSDLLNRAITLLDSLLGDRTANKTSVMLIRHAATLDLYMFEKAEFYDKLERARQHTGARGLLLSQAMLQVQDIITILFLGAGLVAFNAWLLLILVVAVVPSFLGETHFNERSYSLSMQWTPERRELDYYRFIAASDQTAKEIKSFGLADFFAKRFQELSDRYYSENKKLAIKRATFGTVFSGIGTLAYYFAYIFIVIQTVEGILTVGTLTFLAGAFSRVSGLMQGIMSRFSAIAEGALYLRDLFDFLALKPEIISKTNALPIPKPIKKGFVFENVGFKYVGSEKWVLRNLSFELKAGEKLALVGENGAGKTTLVKLLARLYEPTEGRILLDGIDLREYQLEDLKKNIGIIFQDYIKFQMKMFENIAIGDIEDIHNEARIKESANKSLASEVISKMPNGYEQLLGKRFKNGVELSGGEWQKVALARAYMRDAQLLILDEPTSALDARAEHEVFLRFSELITGKMAVLISHRFSTVRMADRILFLENGTVKELGSHEELMKQGGKYAELFLLQAKGYV